MISYHATAFVFRCPVRIRVEGAGTFSFPRTVLFSSFTWGILRRRHFAGRSNFRTFTLRTDGRTLNRSGGLVPNCEVCRTGPETYQFFSYIFGKTPVWTVINCCHGNKGSGHLGSRNQTKNGHRKSTQTFASFTPAFATQTFTTSVFTPLPIRR